MTWTEWAHLPSRFLAVVFWTGAVACTSETATSEPMNDAGSDAAPDSALDGPNGEAACLHKACGDPCDECEWGACQDDAAPHQLQCNATGKCQYISMTNTPPACVGPIACGDGSCGDGQTCHCMFAPAKRCCPAGTECEPCGS